MTVNNQSANNLEADIRTVLANSTNSLRKRPGHEDNYNDAQVAPTNQQKPHRQSVIEGTMQIVMNENPALCGDLYRQHQAYAELLDWMDRWSLPRMKRTAEYAGLVMAGKQFTQAVTAPVYSGQTTMELMAHVAMAGDCASREKKS